MFDFIGGAQRAIIFEKHIYFLFGAQKARVV